MIATYSTLHANATVNTSIPNCDPPIHTLVKIPIIGARRVGKTSILEQFVRCECTKNPPPTQRPLFHYPVVLFNEHVYNLRLIDCPVLTYFPRNSIQEWSDYPGCSLRSATAFVLVFDITCYDSFEHVRRLREQILSEGIDVPIVVVANKADLLHPADRSEARRDVASLVKKQWKGSVFVECSAKYNWHVGAVFTEVMKMIDNRDGGHKPTAAQAVQDAFRRTWCSIM